MRVYHFINRKYGLQALRRKRLKVSLIDQLNDPFEVAGFASHNPEERQALAGVKAGLTQFSGMLCFSGKWSNPLQWSHYADRHKGLCLGFDVPDGLLTPVKYRSTRLKLDATVMEAMQAESQAAHEMMLQLVTTKFSHWRYENEQRLFVDLKDKDARGLYFYAFSDDLALREVIVGTSSTISRAELTRALGRRVNEVTMFKAQLASHSFRVMRQRAASHWK